MPLSILELLAGDTTYISKHNTNYVAIKAAIEALQAAIMGGGAGQSAAGGLQEIFDRDGIIGKDSYKVTTTTPNTSVSVAAGAFFHFSTLSYLKKTNVTVLSFLGKSNGTYYINVDTAGIPVIGATSSTSYSIYTVVWNGASVSAGDITRFAPILFDGDDYADVLNGGSLGGPYESLSDRLDDIEDNIGGAGSGTSSLSWTLHQAFAGTAGNTDHALFQVERGTEPDVAIRWNEQANKWQFTNDGSTWNDMPTSASGSATGTNETNWTIDEDNAGAPVETRVTFNGGSGVDVIVRATAGRALQFSLDGGVTWHDFMAADGFNIGSGKTNRVYYKEADVSVLSVANESDSSDWVEVDLTTSLTELAVGEQAVAAILRVFYNDSAPAASTRIRFRKGGSVETPDGSNAVYAYTTAAKPDPSIIQVPLSTDDTFEYFIEASGANTAAADVYLVGYIVEKTGAGTQKQTFSAGSMSVVASTSQTFNQPSWLDRGLVWFLEVSQTGMSAGSFTVEFYADDAFTILLYRATSIAFGETFQDSLPWFYEDEDSTRELHVKVTNNGTGTGVFTITLKAERFA